MERLQKAGESPDSDVAPVSELQTDSFVSEKGKKGTMKKRHSAGAKQEHEGCRLDVTHDFLLFGTS